jgi:hypothetical protein
MGKIRFIFGVGFILAICMSACYSPPEFPIEPTIEYHNVEFKEVANSLDSLIISLRFQDGDGDLGLDPAETQRPYNSAWFFATNPGDPDPEPLSYSHRDTPPWDTLPPYEWPYTCTNYTTNHGFTGYEGDTLYYQTNEDHWHIIVEYWVKNNGIWREFDWELAFEPQCTDSYNGRFPVLDDDNASTPLEGVLRYGMTSSGFKFLFRNDTMKLRVKIKDRALNNSNFMETPEFVLRDILVEE